MMASIFNEGQIERLFWARPVSDTIVLSAFGAVILLTIFLYCRRQGLPKWVRISLGLTRLVALGLIVAALFEPTATIKQTLTEKRRLPILVDVSESMSIKDQRKRSEDIGEAAVALGILPLMETPEEVNRNALSLADKSRQAVADASRFVRE